MPDKKRWCVEDGDGVHAMPSESEARRYAKRLRLMCRMLHREKPSPFWPPIWEEVKLWRYDAEDHQKEVDEYLADKKRLIKSPKRRREVIRSLPKGKKFFY